MARTKRTLKRQEARIADFYATEAAKLGQLWARCPDMRIRAALREIIAEAEEMEGSLRREANSLKA